jgi:hypothetical protein
MPLKGFVDDLVRLLTILSPERISLSPLRP